MEDRKNKKWSKQSIIIESKEIQWKINIENIIAVLFLSHSAINTSWKLLYSINQIFRWPWTRTDFLQLVKSYINSILKIVQQLVTGIFVEVASPRKIFFLVLIFCMIHTKFSNSRFHLLLSCSPQNLNAVGNADVLLALIGQEPDKINLLITRNIVKVLILCI